MEISGLIMCETVNQCKSTGCRKQGYKGTRQSLAGALKQIIILAIQHHMILLNAINNLCN